MTNSEKALQDLEDNQLSSEFIKVIETNILLAGMVGGLEINTGEHQGLTVFTML